MQLYGVQFELDALDQFCRASETTLISCFEQYNATLRPRVEAYVAKRQQEREESQQRESAQALATQLQQQREEELALKRREVELLEERNAIEASKPAGITIYGQ